MFVRVLVRVIFCILLFCLPFSWATTFVLPTKGDLVGELHYATPQMGETLSELGIRYDIGYYEMVRANPKADPARPLSPEMRLVIPSQYILPRVPHEGIVINLAEYRLYYFPPDNNVVLTMPVGIGREGWTTPLGLTKVIRKERDPVWRPTAKLQEEAEKKGMPIPNTFPPGEANPLGRHVLRLEWPTYLIHGTNRRDGVGARVSAGCIRMMPEDIEYLFDFVAVGTPVRIINEPIKIGYQKGKLYMQAHPLLIEQNGSNLNSLADVLLKAKRANNQLVREELMHPSGIPKKITG